MGFPWKSAELPLKLRMNRELWVNHVAEYTGSRMHPMVTRIGGLTHTPTENWLAKIDELVAVTENLFTELETEINSELKSLWGIGVLTKVDAVEFAVSGPVARASGYDIDLRRTGRGLKYQELSESINTVAAGDVSTRLSTLIIELKQALVWLSELTPICKSKLDHEIDVLLPKVIRVPEGIYTHDLETPLGIASWLLVSKNDKYPYRLKLRPASLPTLLATKKVLVGTRVENIDAVIASMPFVSGDVDR
jgi:NADH-quinone oxidoreductase subunit D